MAIPFRQFPFLLGCLLGVGATLKPAFDDHRVDYRATREWAREAMQHRRRRRLDGVENDDPILSKTHRRLTVKCSVEPLFDCPQCADDLHRQQEAVFKAIVAQHPDATLLSFNEKLMNSLSFTVPLSDDDASVEAAILNIPGVERLYPAEDYDPMSFEEALLLMDAADFGGNVRPTSTQPCATGRGIRIAVLDTGIDYTHQLLGGEGTVLAFRDAYGDGVDAVENSRRDGLFPTVRVIEGYDFVGDTRGTGFGDEDPIDSQGHGTAVSHGILTVAPDAELVAVRVCRSTGCPDYALLSGLEYALDPNGDGVMDDRVDIVNFSLGIRSTSPYHSVVALALERLVEYGTLPVVAIGNEGNIPYVSGALGGSPNVLSVGATEVPANVMASYSSRGPSEGGIVKPDLVAPGGPFQMAAAGTGSTTGFKGMGTSFATPLVVGAAALLREKCNECSPLAIRALLMNTAEHSNLYYNSTTTELAPVSWMGSGQIQIQRALEAEFWAYCVDTGQPAIGLGVIDAAADIAFRKTIRVRNISGRSQLLYLRADFRQEDDLASGAVTISFSEMFLSLDGCGDEATIEITIEIDASKAPPNHMTDSGEHGTQSSPLDFNEFDGWIVISNNDGREISLPFHMILRQVSDLRGATPILPEIDSLPTQIPIGLVNVGAGVAQIDAYELIYTSEDDPEPERGSNSPPSDFRYIGYRTVPVNERGCRYLLEFAIVVWERERTLQTTHYFVYLNTDRVGDDDLLLYNAGYLHSTAKSECRIQVFGTGERLCTGYAPDHSTNSATTVLRMCTDDLGLPQRSGTIRLRVTTRTYPSTDVVTDTTDDIDIAIPTPGLMARSYDVQPGERLRQIDVSGTGVTPSGELPLGLLLVTNAYRSDSSTGASTRDTEAIAIVREDVTLPRERTEDRLQFPPPADTRGPSCFWRESTSACLRPTRRLRATPVRPSTATTNLTATLDFRLYSGATPQGLSSVCPEETVPRPSLATQYPTIAPSGAPTDIYSSQPSPSPVLSENSLGGRSGGSPAYALLLVGGLVVLGGILW